jgi:hypothetical protein
MTVWTSAQLAAYMTMTAGERDHALWGVSTLFGPDPARQIPVFLGATAEVLGGFPDGLVDVRLLEIADSDASGRTGDLARQPPHRLGSGERMVQPISASARPTSTSLSWRFGFQRGVTVASRSQLGLPA